MIALTAWNDKRIYVDPHEIAVIEPADGDVAFLAMPPEVKVAGAVITLAAGRAIVVKEDQDAVYALIRPVIEPIAEAKTEPKRTWSGWRRTTAEA